MPRDISVKCPTRCEPDHFGTVFFPVTVFLTVYVLTLYRRDPRDAQPTRTDRLPSCQLARSRREHLSCSRSKRTPPSVSEPANLPRSARLQMSNGSSSSFRSTISSLTQRRV